MSTVATPTKQPTQLHKLVRFIFRIIGGHLCPPYVLLILLTQTINADYQTGLDAYNDGNYKTAMHEWQAVIATPPGKISPATSAETHYAIGMLYWMGLGVKPSQPEASVWLHKAAELGHAGAQGKLGYFYTAGITVPQNYDIAFQWFSKAAKQGDVDGQFNLGIFYLNGWGVEQDKTMAAQYLAAASAQGDEAAEVALQEILGGGEAPVVSEVVDGDVDVGLNENDVVDMNIHPTGGQILAEDWILGQDPEDYTIQVIGLRSIQNLETLIQNHDNLAPFAIYTLQRNNKPLHLLVQGVYPDVESARKARDEFPPAIQKPENVWIRKFGKIQELIR